ncbi:hypothetical protein AB0M20_09175 [Actinoplanes sp. NPDC051633]|uniref:hypothetical protein n=1 Tax=Actinoplanes sp. NPDC051633 TaxID=3155670 RepID=UPI00342EA55D
MSQVSVFFVDAGTGETFARSDMPAGQVPVTFAPATTVQIGDDSWEVERADYVTDSRLVLTVRRLSTMPPREILYSLPSIADGLPPAGPGHSGEPVLDLHEDDWRQVELVSSALGPQVSAEFDEIERVLSAQAQHDAEGRVIGYRNIHLRSLTSLVTPVPWPGRDTGEVRLGGSPVAGSFAHNLGGAWCYGVAGPAGATVVGLHPNATPVAASLRPLLVEHDLLVVDWCRRVIH